MVEGGRGGRGGHDVVVVDAEVLEEVEEKLVEHVGFLGISFSGGDFWVHQAIGVKWPGVAASMPTPEIVASRGGAWEGGLKPYICAFACRELTRQASPRSPCIIPK